MTTADDKPDSAALDVAMRAHPVVALAITRVGNRARAAEADRDKAIGERDAERREHAKTKAKLDVTESALDKYTKAFGGQPPVPAGSHETGPTDADLAKIVAAMSPEEKAIALVKATPAARFTLDGAAQLGGGMFKR